MTSGLSRNRNCSSRGSGTSGYTVIEVLVAAAILAIGVAAASTLALTMAEQQRASAQFSKALNYQEQAARLYQLGLASSSITNIMPRPAGATVTFLSETNIDSSVGLCQAIICRLVYDPGSSKLTSSDAEPARTIDVRVVRPTDR
jgi:prepilin-type N-terminal cleavage/methylation domain-containing protein